MSPLTHARSTAPAGDPLRRSFASSVEDLAQALLQSAVVAFALVDAGHVVASSPALRELLGATGIDPHIDGHPLAGLAVEADRAGLAAYCKGLLQAGGRAEHRCRLQLGTGPVVPVLLQGATVPVESGRQLVVVVSNLGPWVGDVPATGAAHIFEAYDPATGFATQQLLLDRLKMALAAARRYRRRTAVLALDLDPLEQVLESLPPAAALDLQAALADTLRNGVRDCDTIARVTAREFVILLPEIGKRADAGITAARLVDACARLFQGHPAHRVTPTIGVAVYPADATSAERLLASAESAMHEARGSTTGRFAFADATDIELHTIEPLQLAPEERRGVPELDTGLEALVGSVNLLIERLHAGALPGTLARGLREAIRLLEDHFSAEERLGRSSPYDRSEEGRHGRRRLLEELDCILIDINEQSVTLAIRHLRDWLAPHLAPDAEPTLIH
jgi:diguanylate cyclase (GGDEF)-like protein